jgi:hypothetical protein
LFLLKHLAPGRFLEEFVPAERAYQRGLGDGHAGNLLRTAYLEAIPAAAAVLPRRWPVDEYTVDQVLSALQSLYQSQMGDTVSTVPVLQEYEFRSSVPVIGPLLARVRSLWYGVAARWAMRYLMQQQEAINQQQDVYVRSLVSMARELAHLALSVGGTQGEQNMGEDT